MDTNLDLNKIIKGEINDLRGSDLCKANLIGVNLDGAS